LNTGESSATYFRRTYKPMHQNVTSHMAYTSLATVQEPQQEYLENDSSNLEWEIIEAERTPKKNVRYDPHSKPEAPNIRRTPTQG
jgi:hypothetical protein